MNVSLSSLHESVRQNLSTGSAIFFDLNADPWMPCPTWKVSKHVKQGILAYDPKELSGFLPRHLFGKKQHLTGYQLQAAAESKHTLNANYLTEMFKYQQTIPAIFREVDLLFLDTIFLSPSGEEFVRRLHFCWGNYEFQWLPQKMSEPVGPDCLVAILKPRKWQ